MPKTKTLILIFFVIAFFVFPVVSYGASGNFDYQVMEGIPGFIQAGKVVDFNTYVSAIYKFGIWTVGIAALLMLSIGAFMYLTSAGNNAAMSSAKGVITDALIGFVLAMLAWLLLYIINPDLVNPKGITGGTGTTQTQTENQTSTSLAKTIVGGNSYSDAEARDLLKKAGMNIQSTGNCSDPNNPKCTSLEGIPAATIPKIIALKTTCGISDITGGTETGHITHSSGKGIIDVRATTRDQKDCLSFNAFSLGIKSICTSSADSGYRKNCNYNEPENIFHIDFGDRSS